MIKSSSLAATSLIDFYEIFRLDDGGRKKFEQFPQL